MALPVYYLNRLWNGDYGERTNRIATRAFGIFTSVIYEFKNRETRNRNSSPEEFMEEFNTQIMNYLFESFMADSSSHADAGVQSTSTKKAINSLSFKLSPYVKLLPKFDAIPVLISCLRHDNIRIVKMAVDTLTLLCQWNHSFVGLITKYMFSSALYRLLCRLHYNISNKLRINHFSNPAPTSRGFFSRILNTTASNENDENDEERRRSAFVLDTEDEFFKSLGDEEAFSELTGLNFSQSGIHYYPFIN